MLTLLTKRVACHPHQVHRCTSLVTSSKRWTEVFAQHGRGRKHERRIELAAWQRDIVDRFPQEFLRGLLYSDGCRTVNRFKTRLPSGRVAEYAYPRCSFSNRSADIRGCSTSTGSGSASAGPSPTHANISVSHRRSVALLDSFVPAKT